VIFKEWEVLLSSSTGYESTRKRSLPSCGVLAQTTSIRQEIDCIIPLTTPKQVLDDWYKRVAVTQRAHYLSAEHFGTRKYWPELQAQRIQAAADVLRPIKPDIILLQEVRDYEACVRLGEAFARCNQSRDTAATPAGLAEIASDDLYFTRSGALTVERTF